MASSDQDSYILISPATSPKIQPNRASSFNPSVFTTYTAHNSAARVWTESVIAAAVRAKHPDLQLTIVNVALCDIVSFAYAGHATVTPLEDDNENLYERSFQAPARRHDEDGGSFADTPLFSTFKYEFRGEMLLVYLVNGRDGDSSYPSVTMAYILSEKKTSEGSGGQTGDRGAVDDLIKGATKWGLALHEEILVFDQGRWVKDPELFAAIAKASWKDVILDGARKRNLIEDVDSFFDGENSYKEFAVPWKRGLIFWGPPGNGKTISIKALMNSLIHRTSPTVCLLYVKTLASIGGPEYSVRRIFTKARAMAPCLLVFEDIDSLVTDRVRSYFLNEVDGLESNNGILMIGSTNHLERLDPGIAKRPSRFDRKYLFPLPSREERILYCRYWRGKLQGNKNVDFPDELCGMIADITDAFSFATLNEAFVAALLAIVSKRRVENSQGEDVGGGRDEARNCLLWKEIQKQIKNLRDEMDNTTVEEE